MKVTLPLASVVAGRGDGGGGEEGVPGGGGEGGAVRLCTTQPESVGGLG